MYAQAALWSGVHLSATWSCGGEEPAPPSQLDVQLRALGRVAPHVRCFRCDSYSYAGQGWPDHDRPTALQLHRFLEALHPGAAREVELCFLQDDAQLSGADVAALQRLQGLARLQLHCGSTARLQPGEVHALGGLAQLTEFDIDCGAAVDAHTRGHLVRSVLQLSRLQRLRLVSGDAGLSPEVAHLTRLAHLRHLTLEDQQVESTARFPRPADFPALESYEFSASGGPKPVSCVAGTGSEGGAACRPGACGRPLSTPLLLQPCLAGRQRCIAASVPQLHSPCAPAPVPSAAHQWLHIVRADVQLFPTNLRPL